METQLNFVLMGKTGHGKSSTGNTILGRRVFQTSSNVASETKDVKSGFAELENYTLTVIDGPGLEDTDLDKVEDKATSAKNMSIALAMCYGCVDAFLLVIRFGVRFTKEDKEALDALKNIFGHHFIKHVIVVVTCGDNFQETMIEDGKPDTSFYEWCREQKDAVFLQLYKDCEGRFVLFNNREKDEGKKRAQIQELVQLAHDLKIRFGRYTSQCFDEATRGREKMILELKAPHLNEQFQKKMCLLRADIDKLSEHSSNEDKEKVRARIRDLRYEIDQHDQGHGVLQELKMSMTTIEQRLHDKEALIVYVLELKQIRASKAMAPSHDSCCIL